ncbi:MAG: hypothetical protein ACRC3J_06580 [Culicoidibacterales bacterium]
MNVVTAFLVAFLTLNIPILTGIGVATFDQPIKPVRAIVQRGILLFGFTVGLGISVQPEALQPLLPLFALVSVYGIQVIENRLNPDRIARVTAIEIMTVGGALTVFATLASTNSPLEFQFYAAIAGMVTTYLVTLSLLQLLQRRLKLAQVPKFMEKLPLLALTLAILAMIFSGFTAIF